MKNDLLDLTEASSLLRQAYVKAITIVQSSSHGSHAHVAAGDIQALLIAAAEAVKALDHEAAMLPFKTYPRGLHLKAGALRAANDDDMPML